METKINGLNKKEWFIFSIEGIKFGIDTTRISKMLPLNEAQQEDQQIGWFHEKIIFSEKKVVYQSPMVLLVKDTQEKLGIIIDQPETILSFARGNIRPLPELVRRSTGTISILAVALSNNAMILLIDFDRLFKI